MTLRWVSLAICLALLPLSAPAQTAPPAGQPTAAQAEAIVLAIWGQAVAHMRANEPRQAIAVLERLVSIAPGVTRFRLELAKAYFLVGDDEKALFHFERALGDPLAESERRAVEAYLGRIAERKNWEVSLGFQLLTESNPGKRTSAETIDIGGLPFVPSETADPGTGYEARAKVVFLPKIDRDQSLRMALGVTDRNFPDDDFDDRRFEAELGIVQRFDGGTEFGLGFSAGSRDIGGADFSDSRGAYLTWGTIPDPRHRVTLRLSAVETDHVDLPNRDGTTVSLGVNVVRVQSSDFALRGALNASVTDAVAGFESGKSLGLSFGATRSFPGGLVMNLDFGLTGERKDAGSGLFPEPRDDRTYFVAVSGLYREFQVQGFTPVLGLRWEERKSNIDLYDYDNLSLTFGLSRQF